MNASRFLAGYALRYWKPLAFTVVSMFALVGVQLFAPWIVREMIGEVTGELSPDAYRRVGTLVGPTGVDIREIPLPELHSAVSMVLQDVFLFTGRWRTTCCSHGPTQPVSRSRLPPARRTPTSSSSIFQ